MKFILPIICQPNIEFDPRNARRELLGFCNIASADFQCFCRM